MKLQKDLIKDLIDKLADVRIKTDTNTDIATTVLVNDGKSIKPIPLGKPVEYHAETKTRKEQTDKQNR